MKKAHISIITIISIIILLLFLFFTTSIQSQKIALESLHETSKAFTSVTRSSSPSVVFIQVEGTKFNSPYQQLPILFVDELSFGSELFERFSGKVLVKTFNLNNHVNSAKK